MNRFATYSENAKADDRTVNLIRSILSEHGRIMTDFIKSGDKYPNIDGFLEVVDEKNFPIGKFEVQIKKLPQNHRFKFQCPIETINYAKEISDSPVLFLFGDLENRKVYWKHMSQEYIDKLYSMRGKNSKSIVMDQNCYFSLETKGYIEKWIDIIYEHKNTYKEYLANKEFYDRVKKLSNTAIGMNQPFYMEIHKFLDFYNSLLDHEFKYLKDLYYPNQWKIGMAIGNYEDRFLSYSLYPLSYYENNVQISHLPTNKEIDHLEKYTNFYRRSPNLLKSDYELLAYEQIFEKLKKVVENKLLSIKDNQIELYSEIIFCFADSFSSKFNYKTLPELPSKYNSDSISVDEIKYMFYRLLPAIHYEVVNNGVNRELYLNRPERAFEFDPFSGFALLPEGMTIEDIERKLPYENDYSFSLYSDKIPFMTLLEIVKILEFLKIDSVTRFQIPPDYNKCKGKSFWNCWTNDEINKNLEFLVNNIPQVYDDMIRRNFPKLAGELKITDSDIIVRFKYPDDYENSFSPIIECLKYKERKLEPVIRMATEEEMEYFETIDTIWDDRFEKHTSSYLNTLSSNMPILDTIYKLLRERLKVYFKDNTKIGMAGF